MAATLAAEGVEPDLIVTSPLSRAAGTAAIVAKALRCRDSVLVDSLLEPGFDLEALVKLIEAHHDANSLLLVGHEPDLSKVAAALGCARIKLQKGGVVEFDVPQSELDQAVLIRLTQPT
jgi:phosphohistidine phosphatase